MRLGIVSDEVHSDLLQAAQWAHERNIHRLELRGLWGRRVPDLTHEQLAQTKAILKDYDMQVSGLSPGIFKCSMHDAEFSRQKEHLLRTMDMANELNTWKIISFGIRKNAQDASGSFERVCDLLCDFARLASEQGFVLCLENEPGYYNGTPEEIIKVQDAVWSSGGRLNWDMGNLSMAGYQDYKKVYDKIRPYIASIHMKDYTKDSHCVPLGAGCLCWKEQILRFIQDDLTFNGQPVDMNLETHCQPLWENASQSYVFVANCIQKFTQDRKQISRY